MKITIETTSDKGQVFCAIYEGDKKLFEVHTNNSASFPLETGKQYALRWTTRTTSIPTRFTVKTAINPPNIGYPGFNMDRSVTKPGENAGGFHFQLK
jgi:hypothetical protein